MLVRKLAAEFTHKWPTVDAFINFMLEDAEEPDLKDVVAVFERLTQSGQYGRPIPENEFVKMLQLQGKEITPHGIWEERAFLMCSMLESYRCDTSKGGCPHARPVN